MAKSQNNAKEKINRLVLIFTILISVAISPWNLLDALNLPKLFFLTLLSFILSLSNSFFKNLYASFKNKDFYSYVMICFLLTVLLSALLSNKILVNNIFGTPGRFSGFITIASLVIMSLWIYINVDSSQKHTFLIALGISGFISNFYYVVQYFGFDIFGWERVYGAPSSVLGNPNFVSALSSISFFVGFFFLSPQQRSNNSAIITTRKSKTNKLSSTFGLLIVFSSIIAIVLNPSQQGLISIAFGLISWVFLVFREKLLSKKRPLTIFAVMIVGIVAFYLIKNQSALDGFKEFVQANFAPRIIYWVTSVLIFLNFPLFGVGMNGIFDYFREFRPVKLANDLNVNLDVGANSAHNLPLEFLAGGGIFVFILYIALQSLILVRYFKGKGQHSFAEKNYFTIWLVIQFQSLINPQPITLLLWNFVFGAILASGNLSEVGKMKEATSNPRSSRVSIKVSKDKKYWLMYLASLVSAISLGSSMFLIRADNQFRRAIESQNLSAIYDTAQAFPTNSSRILYAAKVMCLNGRPEEGAALIKRGLSQYPRDYELLRLALTIQEPTNFRVEIAKRIMELDPRNPDLNLEILLKNEIGCRKG
jgi:hypothetical protein